jgi:hypothetical protein
MIYQNTRGNDHKEKENSFHGSNKRRCSWWKDSIGIGRRCSFKEYYIQKVLAEDGAYDSKENLVSW